MTVSELLVQLIESEELSRSLLIENPDNDNEVYLVKTVTIKTDDTAKTVYINFKVGEKFFYDPFRLSEEDKQRWRTASKVTVRGLIDSILSAADGVRHFTRYTIAVDCPELWYLTPVEAMFISEYALQLTKSLHWGCIIERLEFSPKDLPNTDPATIRHL